MAALVRAGSGDPPELPLRHSCKTTEVPICPSDRRLLEAPVPDPSDAFGLESRARQLGWTILTPDDPGWPEILWRELCDPPLVLYIRGSLHSPSRRSVAIVGSRHPTGNGLQLARSIARRLATEGVVVVSGLALGIDAAAHRGALDVEGETVAVLGSGIDCPSPMSHTRLADRVAERGALVSEFPPGVAPRPLHFPRRNRLIAALASVLLVVEGGKRSGARSTVDHALALGREIAAVPRDPTHPGSILPNELLRSGATPISNAAELLALLDSTRRATAPGHESSEEWRAGIINEIDQSLLDSVGARGVTVEALHVMKGRPCEEILQSLGRLELSGRLRRTPGNRFKRV